MTAPVEPCECGRLFMRSRNKGARPPGVLRHGGFGLCDTCYNRERYTAEGRAAGFYTDPPDEVVIDRAVEGRPPAGIRPVESRAAVAILSARGLSAAQIADHLGCTTRTVQRHRARNRAAA